jgi:hypothetical protein
LAADSRLTSGARRTTDDATKIFKVGIEIYGATPAAGPRDALPELLHRATFELCFAGSYLNGSLLADTMEEVMSSIQGAPGISDFSIGNLSSIAFAIYKQVSRQLMEINGHHGLAEVLLGGTCPVSNMFHMYRFYPVSPQPGGMVEFAKEEIILGRQLYFLGDGAAKGRALVTKLNRQYSPYHLLREVIQDASAPTVGGNIQTGVFDPTGFKNNGIMEYTQFTDEFGNAQVKDTFRFRNLLLDLDANELRSGNINIMKSFVNPFETEREDYFQRILDDLNKEDQP